MARISYVEYRPIRGAPHLDFVWVVNRRITLTFEATPVHHSGECPIDRIIVDLY